MLPISNIKRHAKGAVWSHFFSCFLVMLVASLIPTLVSNVAIGQITAGVDFASPDFDAAAFLSDNLERFFIAEIISFVALIVNLPFEFCLFRYFLVLSGTPPLVRCSLRVFFSGMENIKKFLKGAVAVLILNVASFFGIIVGYFPVYLSLVMSLFYIAYLPDISLSEAFSKSRAMMRGHKREAFRVILEFVILKVVSTMFSFFGMGLFSLILEIAGQSLLYTSLAVIFIHLADAEPIEKKDT